jgi:hypothetical protein
MKPIKIHNMKKFFLIALVTVFTASIFAQTQKQTKLIEVKGVKIEQQRGADANIKTAKPVTEVVADKSRGPVYGDNYCDVNLENNTGFTIDIYVDGNYRGTLGAWENKVTWAIPGKTRLYGKSVGGTVQWGPSLVDCDWKYTWRLNY